MIKIPCSKCGSEGKGLEQVFSDSSRWDTYLTFDCNQCGYKGARLFNSGAVKPLPGEWSRHAKSELALHAKDVLQPKNKNGTISRHFVEAHGTKTLEKEMKMSPREIHQLIE